MRSFIIRTALFVCLTDAVYFLLAFQYSVKNLPFDYLSVFGVMSVWSVAFALGVLFPFFFYPDSSDYV